MTTPETPEHRDHWRAALNTYLARRERTRTLRAQLAAARTAGKTLRHQHRQQNAQRSVEPDAAPTHARETEPGAES